MRQLLSGILSLCAVTSLCAGPPIWPEWRGPRRDGVADGGPWPSTLDSLKVTWTATDLGSSYSGPIVGEKLVYTTGTVDKKREVVRALDRASGQEVWRAEWDGAMTVPFFAARNGSWIRATPALNDGVLYVAGMRDVLVALDAQTGKERWRVDFPKETGSPLPTFGFVSSPLVIGDAVFVQAGGALVKLDKATGKRLWTALKDGGGMMHSAFSSPVLATLAGKSQLLVQTRTDLAGVDPDTGSVYWTRPIPAFRGMNILTPQPVLGGIFTSTYGGTTQWFPVNETGGKVVPGEGWSLRYEGYMTSPVVIRDHAYLLGKDQRAICVNLKTGKESWRSDQRFGQYWSLVTDGEKLLALDQRGRLILFPANPEEFEILAERDLSTGETWAHLAVCGKELFVRDLNGLTCYRWEATTR